MCTVQIGDSYRDKVVVTSSGDKRHIMFIIAESEDELLVVPMDTYPEEETNCDPGKKVYVLMANEFPLESGDFNYEYIKHKSFINYKRTEIVSKHNVEVLINNYDIDVLSPISDDFLNALISKGKTSRFMKKNCKFFLECHPWT